VIELADTSAWTNRQRSEGLSQAFARSLERGEIAICDPVKIELLWRERDVSAVAARRDELAALRSVPAGERVWRRALDVLELLAEQGPLHHRGPKLADLVIAAAAERAELPVLHYDRHFEVIASVTGQEVRALAPLGSLP
jgi:predicted nucleic acid-binding protein